MVWFGNELFKTVEFPTALIYVILEKIRKKAWGQWWQHHQTKLSMVLTSAITCISSLDGICNLYVQVPSYIY
jgi:hypothetical protein